MSVALGLATEYGDFSRGSAATFFDADGILRAAGPNVLRLDHDPVTGKALGAWLEGSETNRGTNSDTLEGMSGSNWLKTDSGIPSPIFGVNWQRLAAASAGSTTIYKNIVAQSATPTASVIVRKGTGPTVMRRFGIRNVTTATNLAFVDLDYDTGELTWSGAQNGTARAEPLGNGAWRISMTPATGISIGNTLSVYVGSSGSPQDAGAYCYAAGLMLGDLSFTSSYVSSGASAAQRLSDSLTFARAGTPEGTVVIEARCAAGYDGFQYLWCWDVLENQNTYILAYRNSETSLRVVVVVGGAVWPMAVLSGLANDTDFRVAFSFSAEHLSASLNGAASVTQTGPTPFPADTLKKMVVGGGRSGLAAWFGTISRLAIFNRACSPAELRELSA